MSMTRKLLLDGHPLWGGVLNSGLNSDYISCVLETKKPTRVGFFVSLFLQVIALEYVPAASLRDLPQ